MGAIEKFSSLIVSFLLLPQNKKTTRGAGFNRDLPDGIYPDFLRQECQGAFINSHRSYAILPGCRLTNVL
jgi:hypothetical protein